MSHLFVRGSSVCPILFVSCFFGDISIILRHVFFFFAQTKPTLRCCTCPRFFFASLWVNAAALAASASSAVGGAKTSSGRLRRFARPRFLLFASYLAPQVCITWWCSDLILRLVRNKQGGLWAASSPANVRPVQWVVAGHSNGWHPNVSRVRQKKPPHAPSVHFNFFVYYILCIVLSLLPIYSKRYH